MECDFRRLCEAALTIRRSTSSSSVRRSPARGGAASCGVLRFRLALLLVAIAALASVASGYPPPLNGVDTLGLADDGSILATVTGGDLDNPYRGRVYESYISRDSGMSWALYDMDAPRDRSPFLAEQPRISFHQSQSVDTPRGEYVIDEWGVARVGAGGRRELVYSTAYLSGDANKWLQERDTRNMRHRVLATRPRAILYHADSGNVIAAMGIQGAAVETPDGRWHKVAVGAYSPTDFSFSAKTRALVESGWLVGAIALALSLSALAVSAASAYKYDMAKDGALAALAALGVLGAFGAIWTTRDDIGGVNLVPMSVALVATLTSWTMILAIVASKSEGVARHMYALLGCVATLPISFGLLLSFEFFETYYRPYVSVFRIAFAIAAFISLIPPLAYHARFIARHWRAFAPAFLGMNALVALAFVLWVQMNVSLAATQAAIVGLVGLAAVVLVRRVRGGTEWG